MGGSSAVDGQGALPLECHILGGRVCWQSILDFCERDECIQSVREIERLAPGKGYIQVDSYRTPEEKEIFESWVLTAKTHYDPDGWKQLFDEAGYTGDYYWTIIT